MRCDGVRILVRRTPTSGQLAGSSTVLLAASVVERGDAALIAGTLVHEATHVRLEQSGIEPWPDLRERIERRCLLEQIALLECVADRADLVTYYRTWIDRVWWSPEQRFERRVRFLEEVGAPAWVTRLYTVLLRPRSLRQRDA